MLTLNLLQIHVLTLARFRFTQPRRHLTVQTGATAKAAVTFRMYPCHRTHNDGRVNNRGIISSTRYCL